MSFLTVLISFNCSSNGGRGNNKDSHFPLLSIAIVVLDDLDQAKDWKYAEDKQRNINSELSINGVTEFICWLNVHG
ncbi:hypothetical protein OFN11_30060, partial [Escherichia coli]|nr:hypothetical protein [Escherichia coli]